jgi:multidrug efflux pump subunit AcrA (membrane-fusion protein)
MKRVVITSLVLGSLMIGLSLAVSVLLVATKKAPAEASIPMGPAPITAATIRVEPMDYQVTLNGFGVVRTKHTVTLKTEISGRILEVHPDLEVGNIISKGELLFRIDDAEFVM